MALLDNGRLDSAVRVIRRANASCPAKADESQVSLVTALAALGRDEEAAAECERVERETTSSTGARAAARAARANILERKAHPERVTPDVLYQAAHDAKQAGHGAESQRLFDQALVALERAASHQSKTDPKHVELDIPNGLAWRRIDDEVSVGWAACPPSLVARGLTGKIIGVVCRDGRTLFANADSDGVDGHSAHVISVGFEPGTAHWLSGSGDGAGRVWDEATGRVVARVETKAGDAVGFSPNGRLLLGGCGESDGARESAHNLCVWTGSGTRLGELDGARLSRSVGGRARFRFSPDGRVLAIVGRAALELWDVEQRRLIRPLEQWRCDRGEEGYCAVASAIEFAPDGTLWSLSSAGAFSHWDAEGRELPGAPSVVRSRADWFGFAFTPQGRWLLGSHDGLHWVTRDTPARLVAAGPPGHPLAFSPTGADLLTSNNDNVFVVDVGAAKERFQLPASESASTAEYSPNGRELLIGYQDAASRWALESLHPNGSLRLWSARTGLAIATIRAVNGTDDSYVMTEGPEARVEFFGDAGRKLALCRAGELTLPFDACAVRFEVEGLLDKARRGDPTYLDP